jgi:hypothetical protein
MRASHGGYRFLLDLAAGLADADTSQRLCVCLPLRQGLSYGSLTAEGVPDAYRP